MDSLTIAKRSLGVFSIALGLAAVMIPRRFGRSIGLDETPEKVAAFGARELAAGAALLSPVKPSPFLWTRVLGDAMDLYGLGKAFNAPNAKRNILVAATAGVAAITVIDVLVAMEATRSSK